MADNTQLDLGSGGDLISTDDIGGGVKVQRVKIQHGADGSATDVSTASPLPVGDAGGSLTVDGTVTVQDGGSTISVDDGAGSLTVDNATLSVTGGGTESGALRVTVASDSTGVLSVDDNGGSLTVDVGTALPAGTNNIGDVDVLTLPAIPAGSNEIGRVRITDGTLTASVRDTGSSDALNVAIVDASGNQITSLGGTQYTEDAPAAADPVGTMLIARRRDTPSASEVSTDGDNIALITTAEGYLRTAVTGTVTVQDGGGAVSVDDNGGTLSVDDGGASITVDGTVTVTGIGTGATDLGKLEDTSHVTGDGGVMVLAVRRDGATSGVSADGDYAALSVDANGALRVTGGGSGTEYTEDAAAAANPVGNALIVVRDDARGGSLTSTDGDNVALRGTNAGELYVKQTDTVPSRVVDLAGNSCMDEANNSLNVTIVSGAVGGSGGTSHTDDSAFSPGTTLITPVGGTYRTSRDALDDNDAGAIALTERRAVFATLESPTGTAVTTGGGVEAAALRVTIANDSTGVLSVDDNGSTLSVDDGAGSLTVDSAQLPAALVSGRLDVNIGAGTVGTELSGPAALGDGDANPTTAQVGACLQGWNGSGWDRVTSETFSGAAHLAVFQSRSILDSTTSGTITADEGTVGNSVVGRAVASIEVTGTWSATLVFEGVVEGTTWFLLTVATASGSRISATTGNGVWFADIAGLTQIRVRADAYTSGTVNVRIVQSVGNPTPAGTFARVLNVIPGTTATDLGKAEDAAHASGDTGLAVLAVRRDTAAVGSSNDGDYSTLNVNATGRLYTSSTIDAALPAGTNNIGDVDILSIAAGDNNIGNVDIVTVPAPLSTTGGGTEATALRVTVASDSTGVLSVDDNGSSLTVDGTVTASSCTGAAAHDSAVSGNPVLIGIEARTTDGTAVSTGDVVRPIADTLGKQVVHVGSIPALVTSGTLNRVNTTAADVIAAAGAGVKIVVTSVLVTNAHATVSTKVSIRDGTTVKWTGYAAAVGGGFAVCGSTPLFVGTANTAVTAICGTTGADVDINVSGYTITN